jgi:hypothetical protein
MPLLLLFRLIIATISRLHAEFIGTLVKRELDILSRQGRIPSYKGG